MVFLWFLMVSDGSIYPQTIPVVVFFTHHKVSQSSCRRFFEPPHRWLGLTVCRRRQKSSSPIQNSPGDDAGRLGGAAVRLPGAAARWDGSGMVLGRFSLKNSHHQTNVLGHRLTAVKI